VQRLLMHRLLGPRPLLALGPLALGLDWLLFGPLLFGPSRLGLGLLGLGPRQVLGRSGHLAGRRPREGERIVVP
jgi:hypothetical protein